MLYNIDINFLWEKYLSIEIELDLSKEDTLYLMVWIFRSLLVWIKQEAKNNNKDIYLNVLKKFSDKKFITQFIKWGLDISDEILVTSKKDIYSEDEKNIYDITVTEFKMPDTVEQLFNN